MKVIGIPWLQYTQILYIMMISSSPFWYDGGLAFLGPVKHQKNFSDNIAMWSHVSFKVINEKKYLFFKLKHPFEEC